MLLVQAVKPLRGKAEVKRQRAEGDWFGRSLYSPLTPSVLKDGACIHKGKREEGNLNLLPSGGADTWGFPKCLNAPSSCPLPSEAEDSVNT